MWINFRFKMYKISSKHSHTLKKFIIKTDNFICIKYEI